MDRESEEAAKTRRPNPNCLECKHPSSFHSKGPGPRPCNAFGCRCSDYREPSQES